MVRGSAENPCHSPCRASPVLRGLLPGIYSETADGDRCLSATGIKVPRADVRTAPVDGTQATFVLTTRRRSGVNWVPGGTGRETCQVLPERPSLGQPEGTRVTFESPTARGLLTMISSLRLMRARSRATVPAQMPCCTFDLSAKLRHGVRTGQIAQMARAFST